MATKKQPTRQLSSFDELDAAGIGAGYTPYGKSEPIQPVETPVEQPRSALRAVADTAVQFGKGAVTGVRMMSDVFGADNAVSGGLRTADDALAGLLSATAKQDQAQVAAIMQEAEGKGWMEQIGLGLKAAGVAPGALLAQAAGTAIPTLASAALTGGAGPMAAAARIAAPALMGGAQGVGATKGAIYDEVKQELLKAGATPAEAEARAVDQQSYGGDSIGQIALGGGLGVLAGGTGMERALSGLRGGVTKAAPGIMGRMGVGGATEAVPELFQGGQEKYATNSALNNEGFKVDPMSGVVANATMEGAAGFGMGAAFGIPRPAVTPQQAEADAIRAAELVPASGPMSTAANAGTEAKAAAVEQAPTASITGADPAQMLQDQAARSNPFMDQIRPSQEAGINPAAGPMSAAGAVALDSGATQAIQLEEANAADQAAYEQATSQQEAQAAEQDTVDKPITTGKLAEAQLSEEDKRAILFSNKSVADGGIQYEGTKDGDVLNGMGAPFKTRFAALRRAQMEGKDWSIAPVFDGFVARRKDAMPAETNTPTGSVGGNITTQAKKEKQPNQPLAAESIAPIATEIVAVESPKSGMDYLMSLEKDAGQGFKSNDTAIDIIKDATQGMTPVAKAAVTKVINQFTSVQKDGTRLIKPDFYEEVSAKFAYVEYMLSDAVKRAANTPVAPTQEPAPVTQPAQPITGEGAGGSQPTQVAASYQGDEPLIGEYATKREAMDALEGYYVGTVQRSGDKFALYAKSKKPAAPAPANKDQTKALDRIAKGTAYFGTPAKASVFISSNGLSDTHKPVKTNDKRWDIVAKDAQTPAVATKPVTPQLPPAAPVAPAAKNGKAEVMRELAKINEQMPEGFEAADGPLGVGLFQNGKPVENVQGLSRVNGYSELLRQANLRAPKPAELSLEDQLSKVQDELASSGMVQNARTRGVRDQLRKAIAERDYPEVLKAVDDDIDTAEEINRAEQFRGDEPIAKTIDRVLKKRGITDEYQKRWTGRLLTAYGQNDELDAETRSYEAKANPTYSGEPAAPAKAPEAAKAAPSTNTIFTEDAAAAARARLKAKLGRLNSGLDPETMMDGITLAGYHIEKGARSFAAFTRAMIGDLGDAVKPYLKSWYMGVKFDPRAAAFDGMDSAAAVESADIDKLAAADDAPQTAKTTLAASLFDAIQEGNMPKDNPALKKLVEAFDGKPADPARMKSAQEQLETAIVMTARAVVAKNEGDKTTFDVLERLYNSQPNLNIRTSTSIANQAYSTPAPLAFVASRLAGITGKSSVLEPTAGNGMLVIGAKVSNTSTNEINDERIASLKSQGFSPSQNDATEGFGALEPQDAVVTNPPFGSVKGADGKPIKVKVDGYDIGQIDHLIAARALEKMKDDGQAVLIIGANKVAGGLSTDDRIFFNWLYGHYNVVGHFEVDGDLYTRQGAAWPVRVIAINGRSKSNTFSPLAGTVKRVNNWSEVYEQYQTILAASRQPVRATSPSPVRAGSGKAGSGGVSVADDTKTSTTDRPVTAGSPVGAGDVAGAGTGVVPNSAKPDPSTVGAGADEQRLHAQPDGARGLEPAGAASPGAAGRQPAKPTGTTALSKPNTGNEFQAPYIPRSSRKDEGVLIPTNMAQPTQDALSALEDEVGDIDEFARKELGYATTDDLHTALMGLQVDSVATAIHQIKKGKAVVIADQTGIGKGRQAAAIIRWAVKQGQTPVFISVKPSLFTDMYGDLADIGTDDVQPFVLNGDAWVAGADGVKLFANKPATHKRRMEAIEASGQLPDGSNAVFMTYSQINKDNLQRRVLMSLAPNSVFILDESHNAAGASSTGEFVIGALGLAKGVTYLSATYAKRPDNMPLYFKTDIGNAAADTDGLAQAMAAGGLPLQTVVSNNLVKAGQMFRRERSYDGVQISSVFDTGNRDLHENLSNEATKALRALVSADKAFHSGYVKALGAELASQGESVQDSAGNQAAAGVQHTEFSSVVHNFVKQMLLGLKAQSAADEAIASLKRGEKPIIAVESTMGSFLNEYAASNGIAQGEELGAFDYRTVLTRALERSRVIIVKDAQGNETKRKVPMSDLDAKTRQAYQAAQAVIDGLKLSIPVSPIDWMRAQIIKAGFSVAEITGRNLSVDYSNPAKPILSAIDQLEQSDKVNTTRQFNSGKLDALILNVAGSTGISLHASEKFSDQRQRHMIVAQAAGDINIFMQMLGRIHRTGQVALPKYTILSVDLPTEKRPTAVLSGKMKSLNANTSSNTESATSVKTSDILNKYGDQIVTQYLSDNYDLARALDVEDLIGGEDAQDDIARKVTGRLALQPIDVQHAFYDEVEGQYNALIEYLNKTNQNDLEPRTFDFDAKETRQEVLFEGPDKSTPFGEDAIYGEYSIKAQGIAMKPEEIREAMKTALGGKESAAHVNELVSELLATWTAQVNANRAKNGLVPGAFDAEKYGSFMTGLYGKDAAATWVAMAEKQIASGKDVQDITADAMANTQGTSEGMEFMREHAIGKTFRIDINSEPYNAVITNIRSTHKTTGSPFSLSKVQLTVSVNGALRSLTIPGTQFKKIVVSAIQGGYRIDQLFKEQPANQRETAKIVTGNLLAAYGEIEGARGTIISFTKQDGTTEQGILLPKLFDYSKNTRGDYRLPDGAAALRFLQQSENKDIGRFGITSRDGNVRVLPAGQGVRVQVPKSKAKGGKFFLDKALIEAGGDFVSSGNYMVSTVYDTQPAEAMLDLLMKKQALYALPSMAEEAKAMGDGAVFSTRDSAPKKQLPLTQIERLVKSAMSGVKNAPTIQVVANPEAIGLRTPVNTVPSGVTLANGDVYVFQSGVGSVLDVDMIVFHELFHKGLQNVMPRTDYVAAMQEISKADSKVQQYAGDWSDSNAAKAQLAELAKKYSGQALADQYEALAIEEGLAMIAEDIKAKREMGTKDMNAMVKRLASWLAKMADKVGMTRIADSIRAMSYSAAEKFVVDTISKAGGRGQAGEMKFKTEDSIENGSRFRSLNSTLTDAANNVRSVKLAAGYEVGDLINGVPGKLNWWHRTVGTQYNLAQRSKPFKRVFDSVQNFIGDVSYFASEAADLAPNILPKLENLKDIGKSPLSADDTKAISAPIFEGTLTWGRDESGKPVKMEVLEAAAAKLTTDQKSQRLLRGNHVTDKTLRMWRGLPIDQYTAIIEGKYESDMLKAGVVWTDAELKSLFKLTDKQIPLYREFRAATDKSLTNLAIADMLRFAGKDVEPIRDVVLDAKTPKEAADTLAEYLRSLAAADGERSDVLMDTADKVIGKGDKAQDLMDRGYAPLSRFGKYTLDVVDENGDRVYFGMFENRFDAAKMNRQMQASFPGATINQGTVSEQAYTLFAGVTPETLELFGDMLGLESTGDGAANEAFQTYLKLAKSSRSAMKRLIQRKGIAGFSEDAGRVLAGFIYSNARQTSSSLHMGEMTQAATDKDAFRNQGELQDAAAKLVDYIKNPQEEAQAFRGLLFAQYIGGSIASAMVNMTQPITMTLPWLAQFGGITSAAKQMASAVKDANKALTGNAKLDAALKRAEEDGTVSPQEVHQLMQQAQGRGTLKSGDGTMAGNALATANNTLSRVMLAWGKPFSWAEQFNRRSTFIAAYRTAVAQGMTDPDAFARRAISETQGVYNKGNKPAWARGAAGSVLFTFKQYSISYVEMLSRMAKNGPEGKRAALLALGILFLLSGAGGMPGADDLDDIISGAMQSMGYNFDSRTKRQAFFAEMFGQGGAQFLERGISGLPGTPIDVSGRMGMGNLIPGTGLFTKKVDHTRDVVELAGPAGDMVKRGFEASAKLIKGEVLGANGAAATIAPKAAQNLAKAFDMANMGMYRDAKGAKVLDTDMTDAVMKGIGFQPNDVKKVQDASFEVQRMIGLNKLTESDLAARWALGLFEKDSDKVKAAREDLAEWNRANPESPIRIKFTQVLQRVKKMNETKAERMIKTAPKEIRNAVRAELEASR